MGCKEYDNNTLKKLRKVELEMLDVFVKICEDNNLTYFLVGGTLLGAVRHAGFIPWDDDIDIGMPRKDYDRFIELAPKLLGEKYLLDCFELNPNYYLPFAKIKKNGTIFDEGCKNDDKLHKGIFIDIIPFENVEKINFALKLRAIIVRNIMDTMLYKKGFRKLKLAGNPYIVFIFSLFTQKRLMKIQRFFLRKCKNDHSKYLNALGGSYHYLKETNLRSNIVPPKPIVFEGKKYAGMHNPDAYLSQVYGDYMKLPPKEKRINHCPLKIKFGDESED